MNIFIAGLTYRVTELDLIDVFEDYGTVSSAKVITDRDTGQSRGFGFVKMTDKADGQRAIKELDEAEYDGRTVYEIVEAEPQINNEEVDDFISSYTFSQ